ncbi:MAG: hypothetical protein GY703_00865 [Gammaproteobacteria bacterium]|nr:hypothetical protein [Gammaproteobacteria bacterium]
MGSLKTPAVTTLYFLIRFALLFFAGVSAAQQPYTGYPGYQHPYPYGQPDQQQTYPPQGQYRYPYGQPGYPNPGQPQPTYSQPRQQQPYTPPGWPSTYSQPRQQQYPFTQPRQQQPRSQPQPARPPSTSQPPRPRQTWPQAPATGYTPDQNQINTGAPRLEVSLSDLHPYVQQTVILSLRIVSNHNLETVQPEFPNTGALVFSRLDGPVARSRMSGGQHEIINEYHYAVTPLESGTINVPAIRVKGKLAGGGNLFDIASPASLLLEVQPMDTSVQPWLPLHGLILQSYLENADAPEAGKPFSLIVDLSAVGATGSQLPTFEDRLRSVDVSVYREKSEIQGKVSSDGRFLLGNRTETFTLVPRHGGKIQIPEMSIRWWNVDTGRAETAIVPIRQLIGKGKPGSGDEKIGDLFPGASSVLLWMPLVGLFGLTIGFWILAWLRQKRFVQVVEEEIALVITFSIKQVYTFFAWLSPIRRLQKVRQVFVRSLPRPFRLWFCVRVVESESDPEVWSYMLKFLANKHLGIPPQLSHGKLADKLTDIHPRADRATMRELMRELDGSLYGSSPLEFHQWKQRFRSQLKPSWLPRGDRGKSRRDRLRKLPSLNPGM